MTSSWRLWGARRPTKSTTGGPSRLAWIHGSSWMNPGRGRGPGSIGGAPTGWSPLEAADRRWAVIHGWDSPRESVDPGLAVERATHPRAGVGRVGHDVVHVAGLRDDA